MLRGLDRHTTRPTDRDDRRPRSCGPTQKQTASRLGWMNRSATAAAGTARRGAGARPGARARAEHDARVPAPASSRARRLIRSIPIDRPALASCTARQRAARCESRKKNIPGQSRGTDRPWASRSRPSQLSQDRRTARSRAVVAGRWSRCVPFTSNFSAAFALPFGEVLQHCAGHRTRDGPFCSPVPTIEQRLIRLEGLSFSRAYYKHCTPSIFIHASPLHRFALVRSFQHCSLMHARKFLERCIRKL